MLEAVELIDKLSSTDPAVLKPATFSLRSRIQERAFLDQFVARRGVAALQGVVRRTTGNTLAYALLSLQTLLELENDGWAGLDRAFVARVVDIIGALLVLLSLPVRGPVLMMLFVQPPSASLTSPARQPPFCAASPRSRSSRLPLLPPRPPQQHPLDPASPSSSRPSSRSPTSCASSSSGSPAATSR